MKRSLVFSVVSLLLLSCTAEVAPELPVQEPEIADESCFEEGRIILEFTEDVAERLENSGTEEMLEQLSSLMDVTSIERLIPYDEQWEARHRAWGLHQFYVLEYDGEIAQTKAAMGGLEGLDGIVSVELPRKAKSTAICNDPYFSKQWDFYNDGTLGSIYKAACDINVIPVWQNFTAGSSDVIVEIQDGGIDLTHEDLAAVVIPAGSNGSKNFVDNNYTIVAHSHGTHVAGTVGAINNNGKGVCGIAGGNDGKGGVRLLSCQVFRTYTDSNGEEKSLSGSMPNAMIWAADHGAVISQNSWGYDYQSDEEAAAGSINSSMKRAVDYFIANAGMDANGNQVGPMAGGVVIFAAGNDSRENAWPAQYEPVIAVGSVGSNFKRAYYSNYGDWVDICAPGGDSKVGSQIYSTIPDNKYGFKQGTSMACPHVSGVAALLVSYFGGPGFTNAMLKEKLLGGAKEGVVDPASKIGNLLDAYGCFSANSTVAPDAVSSYDVSSSANNLLYKIVVPKDTDDAQAHAFRILVSKDRSAFSSVSDPLNPPAAVLGFTVTNVDYIKAGNVFEARVGGLEFNTQYYTVVYAMDYSKNLSAASAVKSATTKENNPPVITTDYTGDLKVKPFETLTVDYLISDPDGHEVKVDFAGGSAAASSSLVRDGCYRLKIVGNVVKAGSYTAKYTVTDPYGAKAEKQINYTILPNATPVSVAPVPNQVITIMGDRVVLNLEEYISDPDGETLTYTITSSDKTVIHLATKGTQLTITSLSYGSANVTVVGRDACGESCTQTFKVLVRNPATKADIYPNPLKPDSEGKSILKVAAGALAEGHVKVVSAGGVTIFDDTVQIGAFSPVEIDMTGCAAGKYTVTVFVDEVTTRQTIYKL